ncbi:titin homolog [Nilaparvata lugens]|uniref:titin homolog n=1 Tax=Nilaparvata lugens TaxID=108931 RepID=UPI00193D3DFA|nr:titin homolog [Nilaparvata lugens]XP_039295552.1 titin homolog [Nilaparvata lugens]XP_039295553.1 titin homolog [Nilaparvata lugens]XP_039295554.1 titin homolog [Nilaparvata lugens]
MVVPEASINNIMGGLESTAGVRLHNHRRKLKQRFDIVRKLGQGTYGKVQLGINKETGQEVAIKTIKKCKIETEADLIRIRREIQIMSSVQHPNIIHIYEVFENREKMVLVMEYAAGGELYDYISEKKVLNEAEARRIFRQIATAVYYCHKHKICHRDLKLENVLLDEHGSAKIADFGLSNVFDETHLLGTFCGSPLYASPEIVKGTPYHGPEVDCWSLGVLLYTLVYGSMPFDGSNFKRLVRQISQGDYFEPKKPSPASPLIAEMLKVNSARRADIVAICSHWWIDSGEAVPCLEVAEELANQTPVRLDLLLSLAPAAVAAAANEKLLIPEQEEEAAPASECPVRSHSLGSLAVTQPIDFLAEEAQRSKKSVDPKPDTTTERRKERSKSKRRERSSSRNRKRDESTPESDSYTEKPHRKSSKSKKKHQKTEETPKKMDDSASTIADESMGEVREVEKIEEKQEKMLEDDLKNSEVAEILQTISQLEKDYKAEDAAIEKGEYSLDDYRMEEGEKGKMIEEAKEEVKTNEEEKKDEEKTVEKEPDKTEPQPTTEPKPPKSETVKKETPSKPDDDKPSKLSSSKPEDDKPKSSKPENDKVKPKLDDDKTKPSKADDDKPKPLMERRKSKIFETAEKFSQLQENAASAKPVAKKVFLPGVKVSDAKRAYERKSSLASSTSMGVVRRGSVADQSQSRRGSVADQSQSRRGSVAGNDQSQSDFDRKFSLASTVALNKLVEDVEKLARAEEERGKREKEEEEKVKEKAEESKEAKQSKEETAKPVEEKKSADKLVGEEKTKAKSSTPEKAKEKSVSPPAAANTQVKKIQNAIQVIGNAIDTNNGEKKAATLPRRKTSRAEIKLTTPKTAKPEYRSEVEHMVAAAPPPTPPSVQRSEVVFPVAAASTSASLGALVAPVSAVATSGAHAAAAQHPVRSKTLPPRDGGAQREVAPREGSVTPREHIIPIRFEATGDERPPPAVKAVEKQRPVSRTNSKTLSRQSTADSDSGSVVSQGEPIRKSPREVIIPIAVEGGGFVTPNLEAVNRMSSLTESDDESSAHGFSLHSTRRPHKQLDTADSVSSDEDDDNFEILTAESLFSALLSKVRNLTHRLNTEETRPPGFPRLFNHHSLFENSPSFSSRRLSEARSFNRADVPWRRSLSRDSSSTLPRDFSTRSSTLRPSLLHSRSIEPGTSKLPRRSSLSLRQTSTDEKPPVYRGQKFPARNLVPETATGALDASSGASSSSKQQSMVRDVDGKMYTNDSKEVENYSTSSYSSSLQDKQFVDEDSKGYSKKLQDKQQVVNEGSSGYSNNSQEKKVVNEGSRGFPSGLQDNQVLNNGGRGLSSNLQEKQVLSSGNINSPTSNSPNKQALDSGRSTSLQENRFGSREYSTNLQEKQSLDCDRRGFSSNLQDDRRGFSSNLQDRRDTDDRMKRYSLQERQSMIREMMDDRMKRNSREEGVRGSFLGDRSSMIREVGEGETRRSTRDEVAKRSTRDEGKSSNIEARRSGSFSSNFSDRNSLMRELGTEERGKTSVSPYWDDKSSNSDLSDSYRTAKNSRSVSVEKNNPLDMSSSGRVLGSYSDLSDDSRKLSKIGSDFLSNGSERSRKISVTKRDEVRRESDVEGVRREYNRSVSTDRRRFSYMEGTLNSPYAASNRVADSLRSRRHTKDFSLTSSGSFSERITAKDIEKFRSEFRRTNSESARLKAAGETSNNVDSSTENSSASEGGNKPVKKADVANNNLVENGGSKSTVDENISPKHGSKNLTDCMNDNSSGGSGINSMTTENGSKDDSKSGEISTNHQQIKDEDCDNLRKLDNSLNEGGDCNGNKKLKNINDDVTKYKKPESPLSFSMKESSYQKPLTNTQYTTRRKSYISSVLDREDGRGLSRIAGRSESNGSPDFRRSISLNQGGNPEDFRIKDSKGVSVRRSHSVTPDRSVLGKYLGGEKSSSVFSEGEKVVGRKLEDYSGESGLGDGQTPLRNRRKSRFLRPDFYDTPREESVYVKNDGEVLGKEENKEVEVKKGKKSRVKETIRSLRESSLPKECDVAISESSLIKRAVSLDDVSTVGSSGGGGGRSKLKTSSPRAKRASSVSSDRRVIVEPLAKIESFVKNKMSMDKRKKREEKTEEEKESLMSRVVRRLSPKLVGKSFRRRSCVGVAPSFGDEQNGDKSGSEARAARIANLKKLDFSKPHRSADSTPSFDDYDESSLLLLSPTDDQSDSWSATSDYLDARDFAVSPTLHSSGAEESVSERIRRKSFYSRFNQLKKKVAKNLPTSASGQSTRLPTQSRLPTYRKSMSSSLPISGGSADSQQVDK